MAEPLVRKEAGTIIRHLGNISVELTMTTNGVRLHEFADDLRTQGYAHQHQPRSHCRKNVQFCSRRDHFHQVYKNILEAAQQGMRVKVNVVAMKGINDGEISDFVALTKDLPLHIRFIEFMPLPATIGIMPKVIGLDEILEIVGRHYAFEPIKHKKHDTAKNFQVAGHAGTFAVISTMTTSPSVMIATG